MRRCKAAGKLTMPTRMHAGRQQQRAHEQQPPGAPPALHSPALGRRLLLLLARQHLGCLSSLQQVGLVGGQAQPSQLLLLSKQRVGSVLCRRVMQQVGPAHQATAAAV